MTDLLYLKDSYLKEFSAKIVEVGENYVVLDKTAFYPEGGGLESDTGKIYCNDKEYVVERVVKEEGKVLHYLDTTDGLEVGIAVKGAIDWDRRYTIMRMHTAAHIISAILYEKYGAKITGNAIGVEKSRIDFNLIGENWKELLKNAIEEANKRISECVEVKIYFLPREEALKIPGIVKLANKMPPNVKELRIVEIPGIDIQADGGPHVKNTCEIGRIEMIKAENKGKGNRRVYYRVVKEV